MSNRSTPSTQMSATAAQTLVALTIAAILLLAAPGIGLAKTFGYTYLDLDDEGEYSILTIQATQRSEQEIEATGSKALGPLDEEYITDGAPWFDYGRAIRTVRIPAEEGYVQPTTLKELFWGLELKTADLSGLDTSAATDMTSLFYSSDLTTFVVGPKCLLDESADRVGIFDNPDSPWHPADEPELTFSSIVEITAYAAQSDTPVTFTNVTDTTPITASGESGECTWELDEEGKLTVRPTEGDEGALGAWDALNEAPWHGVAEDILSAEFVGTVHASVCGGMFYGCKNMKSVDLSNLDTSSATAMLWMFNSCSSLKTLDVTPLDTSHVTNFSRMFGQCRSLKSIDLTGFDTSSATNMEGMFSMCTMLTELDLSSFATSNVTDFSAMFSGCEKLVSVDISSFDTSNATTMRRMFQNAFNLKSVDVSSFSTAKVETMARMFSSCSSLTTLDLSSFDTENVRVMEDFCSGCDSLTSIHLGTRFSVPEDPWETENPDQRQPIFPDGQWQSDDDDKLYTLMEAPPGVDATYTLVSNRNMSQPYAALDSKGTLRIVSEKPSSGTAYKLDIAGYSSAKDVPWHKNRSKIKAVKVETSEMFASYAHWFENCPNLKTADLEELDMRNVRDLSGMFANCSTLTSVKLPTRYGPSGRVDYSKMFWGCRNLTKLDLSNFDTRKATSMRRMLHGCESLKTIVVGSYFGFRSTEAHRLPGGEFPSGAWRQGSTSTAYLSDSIPAYTAATYTRLSTEQLASPDYTIVQTLMETNEDTPTLTIESSIDPETGAEELDYIVDDSYPSETLYVGESPRAASTKTLASVSKVTKTTLRSVKNDSRITAVVVPSSVSSIAAYAFSDAKKVTKVTVKSGKLTTKSSVKNCLSRSNVKTLATSGLSASKKTAVKNAFNKWSGKKVA